MEKLENGNVNKKNKVEKVRIIKSGYGNEELLNSFYNYLKEKIFRKFLEWNRLIL